MKRKGWMIHSRRVYFVRLLLSSLLVLAVPEALMGSIWYAMGRHAEKQSVMEIQQHHMELLSVEIGNLVSSMEREITGLEYGKVLKAYEKEPSPSAVVDVIREMSMIKSMSGSVSSIYLYDKKRDWIYTTLGQSGAMDEFYDNEWTKELQPAASIQHLAVRQSQDTPVLSIVLDGNRAVCLVVNIDITTLTGELYRKYVVDARELYLTDQTGRILSGYGKDAEKLEQGSMQGFLMPGEEARWWNRDGNLYYASFAGYENICCVEKIPYALIYQNMRRSGFLIISLILLIVAGAAVFSIFIARRLYEPIGELYQNLQKNSGSERTSGDEIAVITRTMRELNQSKELGVQEIARQREQLQAEMLRLLLNHMISREDFLKETDLDRDGEHSFRFMVCQMGSGRQTAAEEKTRKQLKEVLNTWMAAQNSGIFTEYHYGIYVALYKEESTSSQVICQVLDELMEEKIYFAVSEEFLLTESIQEVFHKTEEEAENKQFFGEKWRTREKKQIEEINIANYEACMIRNILLGKSEEIEQELLPLRRELLELGNREQVLEAALRIVITVDKECHTRRETDEVKQFSVLLPDCENLEDLMELLHQEFMQMCSNVKSNGGNENEYYTKACSYIKKNYNRNINVTDAADELGISYAYLSKIFKSQSEGGEKLLDYLNRIRIKEAKKLLSETSLSLTEIAEAVGYNNTQSLQRFFKKYEAITPGDWRKMNDRAE
ncbi:MAG: AraC family transcriptional regulator [Lachnospiraceae bacterium]|nr:AraC family transcriptional regulator [Lachnospiraceae bacterium]